MSKTHDHAPAAPVATTSKTGRRSRPPQGAPAAADPVAEAMRTQAVAAVTAPGTDPEEEFDATAVFSIEQLLERHGTATVAEVNAYLEGDTLEKLIAEGASVATPRLTRDGARIWGTVSAFFLRATPAQRAYVPFITDDFLRVAIWSTSQGQVAFAAMKNVSTTIAAVRTGRNTGNDQLRRLGGERRDVLYSGLRGLAGRKGDLRSQVEEVYRGSNRPADIAATLRELVRIGRLVLADASPAIVQRRRGSLITAELLTESEALATQVESSGEEAAAVPVSPPVVQADVDLWDGRNLAFLEVAIDAFETGHAVDPGIPRLIPISLRSWLGRRRSERKAQPAPGTPRPTPPAPTPAPATPPSSKPPASSTSSA
jgi:hypothetical protein